MGMGISHLLAALCGGAVVQICHEAWRRICAAADDVERPIEPPTMDDLMLESCHHRSELSRIEDTVRNRIGAKPDSDEADVVLHAVRDGHDWQAVLNLERDYLCGGGFNKQRVARWM